MFTSIRLGLILTALLGVALVGCGKKPATFSLLPEAEEFSQSVASNNKVDILWVVDGSGTMVNHQANLANNFRAFIDGFVSKGFDYRMAVTSVDAWVRERNYNAGACTTNPNPSMSPNTIYTSSADCKATLATYGDLTKFRDGDIYGAVGGAPGVRSGKYLITSAMPEADVVTTFATNVKVGVRADGTRESGFQSIRAVLRRNADGSIGYNGETHTDLASFRRPDAFLAVIIVTDEEDQGRKPDNTTYASTQEYVDAFKTFMDGYTASVEGARRYNVSAITIDDINNCSYGLHAQATQGDRYVAIAQATNGVVGSICSQDFSAKLGEIAGRIAVLSTRFPLSREPVSGTIYVRVDGNVIPQDMVNGWTYVREGDFHYVEFHGSAIPQQGAAINIDYDPLTLK